MKPAAVSNVLLDERDELKRRLRRMTTERDAALRERLGALELRDAELGARLDVVANLELARRALEDLLTVATNARAAARTIPAGYVAEHCRAVLSAIRPSVTAKGETP